MRAITLAIKNSLDEFKRITPSVISFLEANHVSATAAYSARVAVEELVVNVIRYAYEDDGEHEIGVELFIDEDCVVVTVEDDGRPFDPGTVEPPDLARALEKRRAGGWGIHLVRSMSDEVTYRRVNDRNRVSVRVRLESAHR